MARSIERLRLEGQRERELVRAFTRNKGLSFEIVVAEFAAALAQQEEPFTFVPTVLPHMPKQKAVFDANHSETAALVLSDWHGGETVTEVEVNGANKFNSVVLANRVYHIINKFKKIVRGHQAMYKIDKVWLMLLGDMISGSIHPELMLTNDLMDVPASILVARLIIMAILEVKTLGLPIEIDCTVGNHPRLLAKMPAKRQAHLSYDWLIYTMVSQYFEKDKQVKFNIHLGQFGVAEVMGHRIILEHGYGAKADESLPSRLRRMFDSPVYRKMTGLTGSAIDCIIIGDKHQAEIGPGYIVNGALCGSNAYGASLRLEPIDAVQQMFGISRKKVRTFHYELEATDVVSESADNPMSEYAIQFMKTHER